MTLANTLPLPHPYPNTFGLHKGLAQLDLDRLRYEFQQKINEMMALMKQMPRELLLVLRYVFVTPPLAPLTQTTYARLCRVWVPCRNQNYMRALNKELGEPVNRFMIMARAAVKGVSYNAHPASGSTHEVSGASEVKVHTITGSFVAPMANNNGPTLTWHFRMART